MFDTYRHHTGIQLPGFSGTRILVAGEAVLDRYVMGETDRISPEAPIPVLHVRGYEERPGNAAFVCANLASLGAAPTLLSVVGADHAASRLRLLLEHCAVNPGALVEDPERPTIMKERLMGSVQSAQRATQQLLRVDHEDTRPLSEAVENRFARQLEIELDRTDGVLVCDIGKGVLTPSLLRVLIEGARRRRKPVIIDPRRTADHSIYRGATALTPNRYETELATGLDLQSPEGWPAAARRLIDSCDLNVCLITLDRDGVFVAERDGRAVHVETTPREVYDVTGAGDVVLAVFGLLLIGGCDPVKTAAVANIAAGLEVARQGAAVISRAELAQALRRSGQGSSRKLMRLEELTAELERHRWAGRRIGFVHGAFNPLQARHVDLLESARAQADLLVVGIRSSRRTADGSRALLRGLNRIIAGIEAVDYVLDAGGCGMTEIISRLRPDAVVSAGTKDGDHRAPPNIKNNGGKPIADIPDNGVITGRMGAARRSGTSPHPPARPVTPRIVHHN